MNITMKTKIISILALLLTVTQGAWAADPFGYWGAEGQNGSINVSGWAYDSDQSSTSIRVHVYVWKKGVNEGDMDHPYTAESLPTDWERPDVNETMKITGVHGFRSTISIAEAGEYAVRAYGINVDGTSGNNVLLENKTVYVTVSAPYSVTYDANGGSGAPSAQEKRTDIDLTLSSTVPTRDGYTFAGWNTADDGSGTPYAAGATYTGNADLSLYAKWTANTYSVHFNGNGSTSGSMDNESFTYDEAKTLTTNAFSRTGYTFDGWATTAGGDVAYADGQSVSNLTAENGATVQLFAHWSSNTTTSGIDWNPSTNSGTFLMPAYNVEVSTELWYILKQNGETPAANMSKTDVFLERTLNNTTWSTFCAPFDAAIPTGWTVKEFTSSDYNASTQTLTLDFTNATSIVKGTPYLVKADVDGPTFDGVSQDWTAYNEVTPATNGGYATFVPVLTPTTINGKGYLYLGGNNTLYYPSGDVNVNGFRAYFKLNNGLTAGDLPNTARAFVLNIDGDQTGIRSLTPDASPKGEGSIYSLDGRKVQNTTRKGIYIVNGKKVVIK
jgi:uncharacterized repeat protein (TIGR02543 family)